MAINAGQIVLFNFPQTDLVIGKMLPALLITKLPSNQLHQDIPNIDGIIETNDSAFLNSGLKSRSLICLTLIAIVEETIFKGKNGEIST